MHKLPKAIVEDWRQLSHERGWRVPEDWSCAAADDVAEALARGGRSEEALERLARFRAMQGVGIEESLSDLYALFDTVPVPDQREVLRLFVASWVEQSEHFASAVSCTDPHSGLSTFAHFSRRLHELYDDVRARPHDERVLAVIRPQTHSASQSARAEYLALTGSKAKALMGPTGSIMAFQGLDLLIVLNRERMAYERLKDLRTEMETISALPDSLTLEFEPLPKLPEDLLRLIASL